MCRTPAEFIHVRLCGIVNASRVYIRESIDNVTSPQLVHQVGYGVQPISQDELLSVSVIVEDKAVNGKSVKDKGRIIAGGHRQNKDDFRSLSTQTVNTESVFILFIGYHF